MSNRQISFANAILEAETIALEKDPNVILYGLGVDDPKGIFGTTTDLHKKFGNSRVFDMPTAENGMTGIAIGAALGGMRPIMTHQRLDFFLLALDQLVNNAAKWKYMFGGKNSVPLTIRLILGRGWGQGPTHSQSLQSWFAHIPGLKVVCPSNPRDAKELLLASIFDPNPVVYLEHRWLHNTTGEVPEGDHRASIGKAHIVNPGTDLTIVTYSYMVPESQRVVKYFKDQYGKTIELIDLKTLSPIDWSTVFTSVAKTGRLLAIDTSHDQCSYSSEIVAKVTQKCWGDLKQAPRLLALPNIPTPTSSALTKEYFIDAFDVARVVSDMLGVSISQAEQLRKPGPHDVPGDWFKRPF